MKKTNIVVSFETEKLDALTFYGEKKDVNISEELVDTIQKLYEKHVPQPTREYLEAKLEKEQIQGKNRKNAPSVVKATKETE